MSESRSKSKSKSSLLTRFRGLILLLLTGGLGGLGGLEMSDYPILSKIIRYIQSDGGIEVAGDGLRSGIVGKLERVTSSRFDPYARAGTFEVKVERLSLSDLEYEPGRTLDLQVRVARVRGGRAESIVWDSRTLGPNRREVGRDELTAGWSEKPFRINWTPGDRYILEVWDTSGRLKFTKLFILSRTGRAEEFPLRPATYVWSIRADGEPTRDAEGNLVVLSGQPVDPNEPETGTGSGSGSGTSAGTSRVATSGRDRR